MAEKLDSYDFNGRWRPMGSRYAEYLDGSIWRVTLTDFPRVRDLRSARSSFYTQAKRRGLKIRSALTEDALIVQAFKPEERSRVQVRSD